MSTNSDSRLLDSKLLADLAFAKLRLSMDLKEVVGCNDMIRAGIIKETMDRIEQEMMNLRKKILLVKPDSLSEM